MRVALILALVGCDDVFDLEPLGPVCTSSAVRDDFDGTAPCEPWGNASSRFATMTLAGGHLDITSSATSGYGSCTAIEHAAVPSTGLFAEISQVQGDAWFGIKTDTDRLVIYTGYGVLKLATMGASFGQADWDPVQMRWWRLRADPEMDAYIAEAGPDGVSWTRFGAARPWPLDTEAQLVIGAGIANETSPQTTRFERLNVCP